MGCKVTTRTGLAGGRYGTNLERTRGGRREEGTSLEFERGEGKEVSTGVGAGRRDESSKGMAGERVFGASRWEGRRGGEGRGSG